MAKLLDRIRRANAGEGARIGFGAIASKPASPRPALVVRQAGGGADAIVAALATGADAILLESAPSRSDLEQGLAGSDKSAVGLALGETIPENLAELTEAGLDFLVLTATSLPLRAIRQEQLTVGFRIPTGLEDARLRTLAGLPGMFVVTQLGGGTAPTIEDFLELRRIGLFLSRMMIVELSAALGADEVAALRDQGLAAILVDGSDPDAVSDLRQRLGSLPAPIKPPSDRPTAVLPASSLSPDSE